MTNVVTRSPTDSADSTMPHACAPIVSLACAGPSVDHAPACTALSTENAITTTHSQVVLRT